MQKKIIGFAVILYVLLAISGGLGVQLHFAGHTPPNGDETTATLDNVTPPQDENDPRLWHNVTSFISTEPNTTDSSSLTDTFYIPGDKFRITYRVKTNPPDTINSDSEPFFLIEVREATGDQGPLAGRLENYRPLTTFITGSFEVEAGNARFYLYIWRVNCTEWEVLVESLH